MANRFGMKGPLGDGDDEVATYILSGRDAYESALDGGLERGIAEDGPATGGEGTVDRGRTEAARRGCLTGGGGAAAAIGDGGGL